MDGRGSEPDRSLLPFIALLPARDFALRMSLFYLAISALVGIYGPYMPVLLDARNVSPFMIGVLMALPSFIRAVSTPVLALLFDQGRDPRWLVGALAGTILLGFVWLEFALVLPAILVTIVLFSIAGSGLYPIADTIAMQGVDKFGISYGRMRLWGSLAYILATFAGALIIGYVGSNAIPAMLILLSLAVLAASALLPRPDQAVTSANAVKFADILTLLQAPRFMTFLAAVSLTQASHALLFNFGSLHWQSLGISPVHIGGLWGIGVVTEITLLAFAAAPLRLLGPRGLIMIGALASVLRWLVTAFDPPLLVLYLMQALHALSFGASMIGSMYLLNQTIPRRLAGTAQGLYAGAATGIALGLVALASGWLYGWLGASSFFVMAGIAAISVWPAWLVLQERRAMLDEAPQ